MKNTTTSGSRIVRSMLVLNVFILLVPGIGREHPGNNAKLDDATTTLQTAEVDTATPTLIPTETATSEPTLTSIPMEFTATSSPIIAVSSPLSDHTIQGAFVSSEIIIRLRKNISEKSIEQCVNAMNGSVVADIDELNAFVVSIPAERVAQSLFDAGSCPGLLYAEPNFIVQITDIIPSDPGWANQYGLGNIRAPQGWEVATGSSAITIAILDTGIDFNHLDLADKIVGGTDLVNNDNIPQDDNGHGTHVAGIAAASSDNGIGVAGVSWGARLMPIKVLNAAGNGTYMNVAAGMIWAADHGAQVINLSLGGGSPSQLLKDAVDYAVSKGVLIVAAAGNSGSNLVLYPAHYGSVIAVAATDASNAHAVFSNYGPEIDLSAPGVNIYSTAPGGYGIRNGTSMATPYVSGLAAILLGLPGNASPSAVTTQMQNTALDLGNPGFDDLFGHGLIQMDAALQSVQPIPTRTSTATSSGASASIPQLPGQFVQIPTFTLTWTSTPLPTTTETAVESPALTSTHTSSTSDTLTPEVVALETAELKGTNESLFLPCSGISLIILGILLFWWATRNRRRPMSGRSHFLARHRYKL